jgi:argininosuccinate lyase
MEKQTKKLWQTDAALDPDVEKYTVGDDYLMDQKLLPYDIQASLAHAKGLRKIGIINAKELKQLEKGLKEILSLWKKGKFVIQRNQEDSHTAIEQYLTKKYGKVGKKIHTGRSRNDQAMVMIRLFMKDELGNIKKLIDSLIKTLQKQSEKYRSVPMPGYTHTQKAMPTTVGVWLDSFTASLKDIKPFLAALQKLIDQSPLGSASGFGIANLKSDRKLTAKLLKFQKVQTNPMYCGLARGHFENIFLQTLTPIMITCGRFANDLLLFTTQEFNFFALPKNMTTGSSIMPQKRNYDVLEIMRANITIFTSYQIQIQDIIKCLISGYHRDLIITKKPLIEGIELFKDTLQIAIKIAERLIVKKDNLSQAMTDDLYATEKVYDLVNKGVPFREAYGKIKKNIIL